MNPAAQHINGFGLSQAVMRDIQGVLVRQPKVRSALLFGSRARGDFNSGSDIDVAVNAPDLSDREFAQLWGQMDALPLVFKLDLVHTDRVLDTPLAASIARDGLPI